ncbi:MAG: pectate lyase [Roseibacillus sp.]|nr:pectate lyase [Roseibacillus sp.]
MMRILLALFTLGICASAKDAGLPETMLAYQRQSGGWPKNYDRTRKLSSSKQRDLRRQRSQDDATIDNGATHTEIHLLAGAFTSTADPRFEKAVLDGIKYLLEAQMANGGWPQRFPGGRGYAAQITFNDNAMIGVMDLLKHIADGHPSFAFVPGRTRRECAEAVERGVACILKCQVVVDGTRTSWCAQHDRHTLRPCRARSYELPSLSGSESVGIVRFLMRIEKPDKNIIRAIESAIAWFKKSKLTGLRLERKTDKSKPNGFDYVVVKDPAAPLLWARFYDLRSNQPIFCGRDGVPKKSLAEIPHERRTGYSWLGPYAHDLLATDMPRWRQRQDQRP